MPIYLLNIVICGFFALVLGEAGLSKVRGGPTPSWFADKFKPTALGALPPGLLWWTIAAAEVVLSIAFGAALAATAAMLPVAPALESYALVGASALFAGLCLGLRLTEDFVGAAHVLIYAGLSMVLAALLS